jgi:hypothetical protein
VLSFHLPFCNFAIVGKEGMSLGLYPDADPRAAQPIRPADALQPGRSCKPAPPHGSADW